MGTCHQRLRAAAEQLVLRKRGKRSLFQRRMRSANPALGWVELEAFPTGSASVATVDAGPASTLVLTIACGEQIREAGVGKAVLGDADASGRRFGGPRLIGKMCHGLWQAH